MHLTPEVQTRFKVETSVSDSTVEESIPRRMREGRMILAPESDFTQVPHGPPMHEQPTEHVPALDLVRAAAVHPAGIEPRAAVSYQRTREMTIDELLLENRKGSESYVGLDAHKKVPDATTGGLPMECALHFNRVRILPSNS